MGTGDRTRTSTCPRSCAMATEQGSTAPAAARRALDEVRLIAEAAGEHVRRAADSELGVARKTESHRLDIVTRVDLEVEQLVCDAIREVSPDATIIAEERGLEQAADLDSDRHEEGPEAFDVLGRRGVDSIEDLWLVDPLDGTVNYAHGIPLCAVSIARYSRGRHVASAIHAPMLGEAYEVAEGGPATCNGDTIRVSSRTELEECLLAVGSTHHPLVREVTRPCLGWRRIGSAAISFAYVACGRFDAYLQLGRLAPWDYAAGVPLVRAAGGTISEFIDRRWQDPVWRPASVVAATPYLREQVVSIPH